MTWTIKPYGGLDGLLLIEGKYFPDDRGFFIESWRADEWAKTGLPELVQDNLSRSKRGVVRGLHYQKPPAEIGKLVRCASGRIFDVAVDIRKTSPTFGRWASIELHDESNQMLWIPAGFAHGFCALSELAAVSYKVTGYWSAGVDGGIRWDDPTIGVAWPVGAASAIVSPKDAALPLLKDALR